MAPILPVLERRVNVLVSPFSDFARRGEDLEFSAKFKVIITRNIRINSDILLKECRFFFIELLGERINSLCRIAQ